jgi:hypothetical protein
MKTSPSIGFFYYLYNLTTSTLATTAASLDKDWFDEMVRSACSYNSTAMSTTHGVATPVFFLITTACAHAYQSRLRQHGLHAVVKGCMLLDEHNTFCLGLPAECSELRA